MAILTILALTILCVMTSSTISIQAQTQTDQKNNDITTGTSDNKKQQQQQQNDKQTKKDSKKDKKESTSSSDTKTTTTTTTTDAPIQSFLPTKTLDKTFPTQITNDNPVLVDQQPQQSQQQAQQQAPLLVAPQKQQQQSDQLKNLTKSNKQVLNEGALSLNSIPFPSNNNNGAYGNYSSGIKKGNTLDNNTVIHDYKNGTNNGGYHKPGKLPNNCTSKYDNHTNMTIVYCYDTITKKQYIVKQPITYNKVYPTSTTTKKIYVQATSQNDNNNYVVAQNNILKSYLASRSNSNNNNDQPSNLLLLDSAQLCSIAGDLNCVTVQSYFKTLGLITTFDSQHQKWFISASVKNIATPKQDLKGITASIIVYNENGDNIGKAIYDKIPVQPDHLSTLKDGSFSTTIPLSDFKGESGNPTFIVINYNIQ